MLRRALNQTKRFPVLTRSIPSGLKHTNVNLQPKPISREISTTALLSIIGGIGGFRLGYKYYDYKKDQEEKSIIKKYYSNVKIKSFDDLIIYLRNSPKFRHRMLLESITHSDLRAIINTSQKLIETLKLLNKENQSLFICLINVDHVDTLLKREKFNTFPTGNIIYVLLSTLPIETQKEILDGCAQSTLLQHCRSPEIIIDILRNFPEIAEVFLEKMSYENLLSYIENATSYSETLKVLSADLQGKLIDYSPFMYLGRCFSFRVKGTGTGTDNDKGLASALIDALAALPKELQDKLIRKIGHYKIEYILENDANTEKKSELLNLIPKDILHDIVQFQHELIREAKLEIIKIIKDLKEEKARVSMFKGRRGLTEEEYRAAGEILKEVSQAPRSY